MNALAAAEGYRSALTRFETHREAEARLLSRLNRNLQQSMTNMPNNISAFMHALYENDRFWAHIAMDLSEDSNQLPEQLRASLISISGFVIRHSANVRKGAASAEPLIDINLAIIRGLRAGEVSK